jgi:hypothetical protein
MLLVTNNIPKGQNIIFASAVYSGISTVQEEPLSFAPLCIPTLYALNPGKPLPIKFKYFSGKITNIPGKKKNHVQGASWFLYAGEIPAYFSAQ